MVSATVGMSGQMEKVIEVQVWNDKLNKEPA